MIRKRIVNLRVALMAAGLVSCALPLSSSALLLGDLTVFSHLGQPLRAVVALKAGSDEELDSRCFSLGRPDNSADYASYLTQAQLELVESEGKTQLKIHTTQAVNDPFVRLRLNGNCGQGHLSRDFTFLLDPVDYQPVHAPGTRPDVVESPTSKGKEQYAWDARQGETLRILAARLYPDQKSSQKKLLRLLRQANPELRNFSVDAPLPEGSVIRFPSMHPVEPASSSVTKPVVQRDHSRRTAQAPVNVPASPAKEESAFRLQLATSDLDLSKIGKMTEAQRLQLREKQLLLDADDQVANTLSMKHRIKQLEEQLESMQKALEKTNNRMQVAEQLASPPALQAEEPRRHARAEADWFAKLSFPVISGFGLALVLMLSAWWYWHRRKMEARLESELEHDFAASEMPLQLSIVTPSPEPRSLSVNKPDVAGEDDDYLSNVSSIFDAEHEAVTFTEAESVLDEADLYLAYGWANRAIELLQDYIDKHPEDTQLWQKLFEVYSSQGMKQEFEQLALRCQSSLDDGGLWVLVQKLGRQLDAENPLYHSNSEAGESVQEALVSEPEPEQEEKAEMDASLDFVLDVKEEPTPEVAEHSKHLELDPLFPETPPDQPQRDEKPG